MQLPSIHMNGTSVQSLYDQYRRAYDAVGVAWDALAMIEVHGRDYYVQGDSHIQVALAEHRARLAQLSTIKTELETVLVHIIETNPHPDKLDARSPANRSLAK